MGEMQMPGGWTMSMVWMRMPGQTWTAAGASFLVMWGTMMVAMMLPSLIPALWRYRKAIAGAGETHVDWRIAIAAAAYFIVWTTFGLIVFPVGAALAALTMQWPAMARAAPVAMGIVILIAGVVQFTGSKARHLACIRTSSSDRLSQRATDSACLYGVRLGLLCGRCCANLMVLLLLGGVMNIGTMALVTMAVTAERLSPSSERAARTIGAIVLAVGMLTVVGAIGVGAGFSRPVGVGAGFSRH
jgi:predicted metal-binding membrane protein